MPRVAPVLYEFVELDNGDYLKIAEAVFRIFDRQEWLRVNRARARIKVFVDKYGIDELRRQVEEELEGDWVSERDFSVEHRLFLDDEREAAPAPPQSYGSPNGDVSEFERFRTANVREQKQEGFVTVEVKVTRGDLTPEQFRGLAEIMRELRGRLRAHDGAAEPRAAVGARGERVRRVASAVASSAWARRARARSTTWCRARARTRASSGSRARWASTRRCRSGSRRWA